MATEAATFLFEREGGRLNGAVGLPYERSVQRYCMFGVCDHVASPFVRLVS